MSDSTNSAQELLPCPFCGGEAERITLEDDENLGGDVICCTDCQASSNVEFGFKENLVANWNRRADLAPDPLGDPRVRALVEALRYMVRHAGQLEEGDGIYWEATEKARAALAALSPTGGNADG